MKATLVSFCYSAAALGFAAIIYSGLQNGLA